jgi:NADPH:quinone reductase
MRALIHDPAALQGLALREVPEPEPAGGQALVAVQAIALNFGELAYLAGLLASGDLDPQIGWRSSWRQASEAAAALLGRQIRGNAVLDLD